MRLSILSTVTQLEDDNPGIWTHIWSDSGSEALWITGYQKSNIWLDGPEEKLDTAQHTVERH